MLLSTFAGGCRCCNDCGTRSYGYGHFVGEHCVCALQYGSYTTTGAYKIVSRAVQKAWWNFNTYSHVTFTMVGWFTWLDCFWRTF